MDNFLVGFCLARLLLSSSPFRRMFSKDAPFAWPRCTTEAEVVATRGRPISGSRWVPARSIRAATRPP